MWRSIPFVVVTAVFDIKEWKAGEGIHVFLLRKAPLNIKQLKYSNVRAFLEYYSAYLIHKLEIAVVFYATFVRCFLGFGQIQSRNQHNQNPHWIFHGLI